MINPLNKGLCQETNPIFQNTVKYPWLCSRKVKGTHCSEPVKSWVPSIMISIKKAAGYLVRLLYSAHIGSELKAI